MASEAIKVARALAKLAALTAQIKGEEAPELNHKELVAAVKEERASRPKAGSMDAEAVLLFLRKPAAFTFKVCKRTECGEAFGTDYHAVAYCSDRCRVKSLAAVGLQWDPTKSPEQRWGGEPPLLLPPEAVSVLLGLVASGGYDTVLPPEPSSSSPLQPSPEVGTVTDENLPAPLGDLLRTSPPEQRLPQSPSLMFEGGDVFGF
jgi:hypothetical protein